MHSPVVRYGGHNSAPQPTLPTGQAVRELLATRHTEASLRRDMKLDKQQPWGVWAFVIGLNLVGFAGYFILRAMGITLYSIHAH